MITPGPITVVGQQTDLGVVAPGTIYTSDNKTYFMKTSGGNVVNLSNGQETPAPPSPFPVTPLPGANLQLG